MTRWRFVVAIQLLTAAACRVPLRVANDPETSMLIASIQSGDGRGFGDALEILAHRNTNEYAAASVARLIASGNLLSSAKTRAATAIGAMGPTAVGAAPELLSLLGDSSQQVRAEAIFALGAVRAADPRMLDALYKVAFTEPIPLIVSRADRAIHDLRLRSLIEPSDALTVRLRAALSDTSAGVRNHAAHVLESVTAPWKNSTLERLLSDPSPQVRETSAYALAAEGSAALAYQAAVQALARDSVDWIRKDVPDLLALLGGKPAPVECSHRAVDALIPARFTILPESQSLSSDGEGPYLQGSGVRSSENYAYNLLLPYASGSDVPVIDGDSSRPGGQPSRALSVNLSSPLQAGPNLGIIRDSTFRISVWMMLDRSNVVWNFRDIPVGASVASDRVQLNITANGRSLLLQFGQWGVGMCNEFYALGGRVNGIGSIRVTINRLSETQYRIATPLDGAGRLWDYSNPAAPRDLGLYNFSFAASIETRP